VVEEVKSKSKSEIGGLIMQHHYIEKQASMSELLEHLDVSSESVLRWIKHSNMPTHKLGRGWMFKFSEVDDCVRSGETADNTDKKPEDQDNGKC
jgi:hypothetical protein